MPVSLVLDFPEGTMEQYRDVCARLDLAVLPPGGLFHAAGMREGDLRIVDVWDELATFERFLTEHLARQVGEVGMQAPRMRTIEVTGVREGSGRPPAVVQVVTLPGVDRAQFEAMDAEVLVDGAAPDGLTYHVNGQVKDGWCVVDGWESVEQLDRFMNERVGPVAARTPLAAPPRAERLDVQAVIPQAGARVAS